MKKLIIKKINGEILSGKYDDINELNLFIENSIKRNIFGLPERPELALNEETGEMEPTGVILPAEYTIEIEDLNQNKEWLLQQAIGKRIAEYPTAEEFLNAFFDGGDEALEQLKQKRLAIKAKYPKP